MGKGGIDYGMGMSNIDRKTGIRFGVVHQNEMGDGFFDSVENEYDPSCPKCGTDLTEKQVTKLESKMKTINGRLKGKCPHCKEYISPDDITPDEPSRSVIKEDGIEATIDSQGDIFITKSPFYTHGTFCSPCAPGAVSVGVKYCTADNERPQGYCLPFSWFNEDERPKPGTIFRVKDGSVVQEGDADA